MMPSSIHLNPSKDNPNKDNIPSGIDVYTDMLPHTFHKLSTLCGLVATNNLGVPNFQLIFVRFRVPLMPTVHYETYGYGPPGFPNPDGKTRAWNIAPRALRNEWVQEYCNYIGGSGHDREREFLHDYVQEGQAAK